MNIRWHNQRFNSSRSQLFQIEKQENLRDFIHIPSNMNSGVVKCRITYDQSILDVEFQQYRRKPIRSLQVIECNFNYDFKFKDRSAINELYNHRMKCDDILMMKKGFITDTSYGNVSFTRNGSWYTPNKPLLKGIRRARLQSLGKLIPQSIHINDVSSYSHICIFNAMIPFGEIIIPISRIYVE